MKVGSVQKLLKLREILFEPDQPGRPMIINNNHLSNDYTLALFLYSSYLALLVVLIIGWSLMRNKKIHSAIPVQNFLSVVIAVRNEEKSILSLLHDLSNQFYHSFEVIVVDDHSEDKTVEVVNKFLSRDSRFKLISAPFNGKKQALASGVGEAQGSIIVTTDADCRVGNQWLSTINACFQHDEIKMVVGGVRIRQDNTFFADIQALEFSSLIGSGAATLMLGVPTMCNGANLAYRKSVFLEVGGYSGNLHIPSGDDEFLMRKIVHKYSKGITFVVDKNSVVETQPVNSLQEFFYQRIRWAGKWRANSSWAPKVLAVFILIVQLFYLPMLLIAVSHQTPVLIALLLGKVLLEGIFLTRVCRFLKVEWHWPAFFILQFIYPVYVVGVGVLSLFLSYTWKDRTTQPVPLSE